MASRALLRVFVPRGVSWHRSRAGFVLSSVEAVSSLCSRSGMEYANTPLLLEFFSSVSLGRAVIYSRTSGYLRCRNRSDCTAHEALTSYGSRRLKPLSFSLRYGSGIVSGTLRVVNVSKDAFIFVTAPRLGARVRRSRGDR